MLLTTLQIGKSIRQYCQSYFIKGFHSLTSRSTSLSNTIVSSILLKPNIAPSILNSSILTRLVLPPLTNQCAGFKVKGRLKRRCKDCYFVMRQQRLYVICKTHPRHKQMSMKQRDYKSWILTHATQSKIRPY